MKTTRNTILITGGGSGIGLALAEEFLKLGNQVIVAGRTKEKLKIAQDKGLKTLTVDMRDATSIQSMARMAVNEFPALNVVIHNAGIMKNEKLKIGGTKNIQDETVETNLLGPMRLTEALMPHFLKQKAATIMTVTSGLAYLPLSMTPTYCATKAGLHSYTESLRYQLKDTNIEVLELVPPYVQTMLMGERQQNDPHAMPLAEFISEVMSLLQQQPTPKEILVKRVMPLRTSQYQGAQGYQEQYNQFNDRMNEARKGE